MPLTSGDKAAMIFAALFALLIIVLNYKQEIDDYNLSESIIKSNLIFKLQHNQKVINKNELIIVAMLNGNYVYIDGVKRYFMACDAAGSCK
jgi:hypothetical protein